MLLTGIGISTGRGINNMKICIIGAGSPYTPELIEELSAMKAELPVQEITLMDIDEKRLELMYNFCKRYIAYLGFDVKINATTSRRKAISGAAFINTQIRVGGNAARILDEKIPLSMGLVGQETTGAGGFAKALRTIPIMLDIAKDVTDLAPDAWIINYTNPTGLVAEAIEKHSTAKIAGLCAGGMFAQDWVARALKCCPQDVRYDFVGLNHMNFSYNITAKGQSISDDDFALAAAHVGSVDLELIQKLGALPSPYLQYYYHEKKKISEMSQKTRGEEIAEIELEIFKDFANPEISAKPESLKKRGGGGYSALAMLVMSAIYNHRDTWAVVNTANRGIFSFLPDDAVIEVPSIINASGIKPIAQSEPPKSVWGLVAGVKNYESLAVEAAITGCRDTALLALLAHPLVGDYEKAVPLLEKLLEAHKEYLPAFWS